MGQEHKGFRRVLPWLGLPVLMLAFLWVRWQQMEPVVLLQFLLLIGFGYTVALKDLKTQLIDNMTVLLMLAAWCLITVPQLLLDTEVAQQRLIASAMGGGMALVIFLTVYYVSKKGLGGGDVKFMAVAGLYLGLGGVMPAMLVGTMLACVVGLLLVALKKLKKTDPIPLAPFLYAGILVTIFLL